MRIRRAPLEDWMRDYYFATTIDLGSSGVECFSLGELRDLLGIEIAELDRIAFDDSETYGGEQLREALADRFIDGSPHRVLATHGSSEAIFLTMNSLLAAGDEVVVMDPGYHSLWSIAESIGCHLTPWQLRPEDGFAPDLTALRTLVTPRTRMVVVNFPHNPTGVSLTGAQLDELLHIVSAAGTYLVWDGALAELTYDTAPLPDPSTRYERCLSVGTMSKAYGLPGTRIGWCLGDPELLARMVPLRDAMTICLSPLTEFVAERAIRGADTLLSIRRTQAAGNRATLAKWVDSRPDLIDMASPIGGCTAFPRIVGVANTDDVCRRLGAEHDVLLLPGSCFGFPDRVRLGFGSAADDFEAGLERVGRLLAETARPLEGTLSR